MTPYELGQLAARTQQVPGHLKQACAQGFAGAFEKRAGTKGGLKGLAGAGPLGGAALGALINYMMTRRNYERNLALDILRRTLPGAAVGGSIGWGHDLYRDTLNRILEDAQQKRQQEFDQENARQHRQRMEESKNLASPDKETTPRYRQNMLDLLDNPEFTPGVGFQR
jgi:hypothetical protein